MVVVILNSGQGKRMGELTAQKPKCLVNLGQKTILERQLNFLKENNICRIIITTGPFSRQIRQLTAEKFPELDISFVHNSLYAETNYIYSLFLTRAFIKEDVLLVHGDLVFGKNVLSQLLNNKFDNMVFVDNKENEKDNDFKAVVKNNEIKKISTTLEGDNVFPLQPLYKFTEKDFKLWLEEMSFFIEEDKVDNYAEDALNNLLEEKIRLIPVKINNEFCREVDNKNDLVEVQKLLERYE